MKMYRLEVTVWEVDERGNVNVAISNDEELIASYEFTDVNEAASLHTRVMTFIEKENTRE